MRSETLSLFTDTCGSPQVRVMKAFGIACQIIQFLEKEGKKEEESAGPAVCLFTLRQLTLSFNPDWLLIKACISMMVWY